MLAETHLEPNHQLDALKLAAYLFPNHGLSLDILEAIFQTGIQPPWGDDLRPWLNVNHDLFEIKLGHGVLMFNLSFATYCNL